MPTRLQIAHKPQTQGWPQCRRSLPPIVTRLRTRTHTLCPLTLEHLALLHCARSLGLHADSRQNPAVCHAEKKLQRATTG